MGTNFRDIVIVSLNDRHGKEVSRIRNHTMFAFHGKCRCYTRMLTSLPCFQIRRATEIEYRILQKTFVESLPQIWQFQSDQKANLKR